MKSLPHNKLFLLNIFFFVTSFCSEKKLRDDLKTISIFSPQNLDWAECMCWEENLFSRWEFFQGNSCGANSPFSLFPFDENFLSEFSLPLSPYVNIHAYLYCYGNEKKFWTSWNYYTVFSLRSVIFALHFFLGVSQEESSSLFLLSHLHSYSTHSRLSTNIVTMTMNYPCSYFTLINYFSSFLFYVQAEYQSYYVGVICKWNLFIWLVMNRKIYINYFINRLNQWMEIFLRDFVDFFWNFTYGNV